MYNAKQSAHDLEDLRIALGIDGGGRDGGAGNVVVLKDMVSGSYDLVNLASYNFV